MATSKKSVAEKGKPVAADQRLPRRSTGRLLVQLDRETGIEKIVKQAKAVGLNLRVGADEWVAGSAAGAAAAHGFVLEHLRIALIEAAAADRLPALLRDKNTAFLAAEPERHLHLLQAGSKGRGRKPLWKDGSAATWGVQAINVLDGEYTGKGVKVAVLDTGFDFAHPDFTGRTIHRKSFVGTKQAIDKEGHGTHTAAVIGGGRKMKGGGGSAAEARAAKGIGGQGVKGAEGQGTRYGVAPGARLYIGKIMDDNGEGSDMHALAGIEWALDKGCQVISMSLGASADEGGGYSPIYEQVGQIAAERRCLLIAAAGNESERELGIVAAVNHPANCPSIMAVGGLTAGLQVAEYSCAGTGEGGGQVDIAAPGDEILSAKPGGGYRRQSGTSMATAFVAGMAALLWEEFPKATAGDVWAKMVQRAARLNLPASDVGAGLVKNIL